MPKAEAHAHRILNNANILLHVAWLGEREEQNDPDSKSVVVRYMQSHTESRQESRDGLKSGLFVLSLVLVFIAMVSVKASQVCIVRFV